MLKAILKLPRSDQGVRSKRGPVRRNQPTSMCLLTELLDFKAAVRSLNPLLSVYFYLGHDAYKQRAVPPLEAAGLSPKPPRRAFVASWVCLASYWHLHDRMRRSCGVHWAEQSAQPAVDRKSGAGLSSDPRHIASVVYRVRALRLRGHGRV